MLSINSFFNRLVVNTSIQIGIIKSSLEEKLGEARKNQNQLPNAGLLLHSDKWSETWYNSHPNSDLDMTVPDETLWQVYHAATTTRDSKNKLQPHVYFSVSQLNPKELSFLYHILLSYINTRNNLNPEEIKINRQYLSIIKKHILSMSQSDVKYVENFYFHLTELGDHQLDDVINWVVSILNPNSQPVSEIDEFIINTLKETKQSINAGLLRYAITWFQGNMLNSPRPSDGLKWQIYFASISYSDSDGTVHLNSEFTINYLNPEELRTFYHILHSYSKTEAGKKFDVSVINQKCLSMIENRFLSLCKEYMPSALIFVQNLIDQEDPELDESILKFEKLIEIFNQINSSDTNSAIILLDEFYKNIEKYSDIERETYFYCLLRIIDNRFPHLKVYDHFFDFSQIHFLSNAPDFGAFRALIKHFNEKEKDSFKYKEKLTNIIITNLVDLQFHLNSLEQSNFIGEKKFLILHRGIVGGHYVPVFIKRTESTVTVIITDAGPFESKFNGVLTVKDLIKGSNLKNIRFFAFEPSRQGDSMSCSIGSFRDILESYKYDLFAYVETVFNEYEETRKSYISFLIPFKKVKIEFKQDVYVIQQYPPRLMKFKQGTSYISGYEKSYPESITEIVASKQLSSNSMVRVDKTLRQVAATHTITNGSRKVNFYLRKKAFKYFIIVAKSLLNQNQSHLRRCCVTGL